jgi:PTH2 family peptidyl-tRNA hydrolase
MGKGKLAGQVGHAVAVYFWQDLKICNAFHCISSRTMDYMTTQQKKIILYAPQSKLEELESEHGKYIAIRDAGYTELAPNTLTCVNIGIIDYDDFPKEMEWIKHLRLVR